MGLVLTRDLETEYTSVVKGKKKHRGNKRKNKRKNNQSEGLKEEEAFLSL